MRTLTKKPFSILPVLVLLLSGLFSIQPHVAHADTLGSITEYTMPTTNSHPYGVIEAPDGSMWVTESSSGKIARYTPSTNTITEYSDGTGGTSIAIDSSGNIWVASGNVVNINESGAVIGSYVIPGALNSQIGGRTGAVAAGPDGNIWFGTLNTVASKAYVVSMSPDGSSYTPHQLPSYGEITYLVPDRVNNCVWFAEMTSSGNQPIIGRITPDGMEEQYEVPSPANFGIQKLYLTSDGKLWFTNGNVIGYMDTSDNNFTLFSTPAGWGNTGGNGITLSPDGNMWITLGNIGKVASVTPSGVMTSYSLPGPTRPMSITTGSDGNVWVADYNANKLAKVGTGFTSSSVDKDGDGLGQTAEMTQGTSDYNPDTDGDGLSDYIESTAYTNRDAVFCNSAASYCEYPDPTSKDLYVEVDWMVKAGSSGYSTKPTATMVSDLVGAYAGHGITAHIDTGQLGGGNEVSYDSSVGLEPDLNTQDLYDYKYATGGVNFNTNRYHIFHYQLIADALAGQPGVGGIAYPGDDDSIVYYGSVKDAGGYPSIDTAVAGTMMHELGHNLCLSGENNAYPGQPADCVFSGIDQFDGLTDYPSVMNDDRTQQMVDYSDGNGTNDHDDWDALRLQDFALSEAGEDSIGTVHYAMPRLLAGGARSSAVSDGHRMIIDNNLN